MLKYVEKLFIDKKLAFTPGRAINKTKIVYPDHYALILKFKNIPLKPTKSLSGSRHSTWNTNKEGGWERYKDITGENSKMDNIGDEAIEDATETMKKVSKELDKCKFVGFGKVSVKDTPLVNKEIDEPIDAKRGVTGNKCQSEEH